MNSYARNDWQSCASDAARAALTSRIRDVTAAWAEARDRYLALWAEDANNVLALRKASQRYQELDRTRRILSDRARQLASGAESDVASGDLPEVVVVASRSRPDSAIATTDEHLAGAERRRF